MSLSGPSNAVGRLYKSTYAFGIWLEHLHGGLTWYIRTPLESPKEPVQSGANYPSWTWMSRWGHEIRFREAMRFDCFEYQGIETRCGASSESTTESKTLLLSGCLKVAEARPLATEWNGESRGRALWFGSVFDAESGDEVGQIAYDENPETIKVSAISCFLCSRGAGLYDQRDFSCLALVPTLKSEGEYRRVGLVFLAKYNWVWSLL